jgi:ADP-ribose pyrophosphatase
MPASKPERLSRSVIYQSPWVNLYVDKVRFPNGRIIERHHLLDFEQQAVMAIVENDWGQILFVQVCRYTTGKTDWELPAGRMEPNESIFEAARREVLEESGLDTRGYKLLYSYNPMNGIANQVFHIVSCRPGPRLQDFDAGEISAVRWSSKDEIRGRLAERAITDGFTLMALLLYLC